MIPCLRCKEQNDDASRFCEACGASLSSVCAACGTLSGATARYCRQCGAALEVIQTAPPSAPGGAALLEDGELRLISVLFADISGSTALIKALDPEAARGQLGPALQTMSDSVCRFGGTVTSVQGDGIMALFGVPNASEDHAVQACLAACDMIDAIAGAGDPRLMIRVGIDSGEVMIQPTGRDESDFGVNGVIAHIAHRAEQHAEPGTACVTSRTARLARGYATLVSLGPVAFKGFAEPLEVFRLLSASTRPSWDVRSSLHELTPFVNRSAELAQLDASFRRAGLGSGQVLALVGSAGLGKSRLVHEFLRTVTRTGAQVLRVAAVSHTAEAPFELAANLLRAWLGVERADNRATVGRKLVEAALGIDGDDLAPLQALLDVPVDAPGWAALPPTVRRTRILAALRALLLRQAVSNVLILIVEDYHWADAPSAELLNSLVEAAATARLFLIVTTRPDRLPPWPQRSYCTQMALPALEPENADSLLRALLGASSPELDTLRSQILAQADGVPLFIEEIARSLIERGIVAGGATPGPAPAALDRIVIPASVQAIIAARIGRLSGPQRRLLQVAAVVGKDVPLKLIGVVSDLPAGQMQLELARLLEAEFIYELAASQGTEYTFRHALIQAVAYDEMLKATRRGLHVRVMHAIQLLYADRLDEMTERLADHARRGEDWAATVHYTLKAGDRAIARWAWRDATRFYETAIDALTRLPENAETIGQAIEARLRLRVALPGVGDLPRIAACLQEARALAVRSDQTSRLGDIDTGMCLTLTKLGRLDEAIAAGRQAHNVASVQGDPAEFLSASFALAQAHWYRGRFEEAEALLAACLPDPGGELHLSSAGTTGTTSMLALVCLAKTQAITGRISSAFKSIAEARRHAEASGKPFDLCYCGVGRGFCLLMADDPHGAIDALEASMRLARAGDIALLIPSSGRYLGSAYAQAGRTLEAMALLDEICERTVSSGLLGMRLWSNAALAETLLRAGDGVAARATVDVTLELAHRHGFAPLQTRLSRLAGGACLALGENDAAKRFLREAATAADGLGMTPEAAWARRDLAGLTRAGEPATGEVLIEPTRPLQ